MDIHIIYCFCNSWTTNQPKLMVFESGGICCIQPVAVFSLGSLAIVSLTIVFHVSFN